MFGGCSFWRNERAFPENQGNIRDGNNEFEEFISLIARSFPEYYLGLE